MSTWIRAPAPSQILFRQTSANGIQWNRQQPYQLRTTHQGAAADILHHMQPSHSTLQLVNIVWTIVQGLLPRHTTISLKSKMRKFRGDSQAVERGRFLLSQPPIALLFESTKAIYPFWCIRRDSGWLAGAAKECKVPTVGCREENNLRVYPGLSW